PGPSSRVSIPHPGRRLPDVPRSGRRLGSGPPRCSNGSLGIPGVDPADAGWLGDGSLYRLVESGLSDPVEIVADLTELLSHETLEHMGLG
ncbi:MAG TPA: hypothetical protein QF905_06375, partial [Acidimicrobiales bacterium]|nr:hypothetical protein [Acidimicrobiales bacterium]